MGYAWLDYNSLSPGSVVGADLGEKVKPIFASVPNRTFAQKCAFVCFGGGSD